MGSLMDPPAVDRLKKSNRQSRPVTEGTVDSAANGRPVSLLQRSHPKSDIRT